MISFEGIPLSFLLMIMLSSLSSSSSYPWADDKVELEPEDIENQEFHASPLTFVYDFYAAIWSFFSSSSNYHLYSLVCNIILEHLTMKLIGKLYEGMVMEEKVKYLRHFDSEIFSFWNLVKVSRRIDAWNLQLNLRESRKKLRLLRNLLEKVEKKQSFILKRRLEVEQMKNSSDDLVIIKRDDDFPKSSGYHGISSKHSTGDDVNKSLLEVSSKINPDGIGDVDDGIDDDSNIDVLKKIPQNVDDLIYLNENSVEVSSKINKNGIIGYGKNDDAPKTIPRISDIDQNSSTVDDVDAVYKMNDNKNMMKFSSKINPSVTDDCNDDTNVDVSKTNPQILDIDDRNSSSTNVDSHEVKMEIFDRLSPSGTSDCPSNREENQRKIKAISKCIEMLEFIKGNKEIAVKEVNHIVEYELTEDDDFFK